MSLNLTVFLMNTNYRFHPNDLHHLISGIMGIRMDGVDNVVFNGLSITDLHEQSKRGSDLCGEYWDEGFARFTGKGNTLQNDPYLYGYTGNRAHGVL